MKSITALATIMAMASQYDMPSEWGRNNLRPEDIDMTPPKKIIPKGCQTFTHHGTKIMYLKETPAHKQKQKLSCREEKPHKQ